MDAPSWGKAAAVVSDAATASLAADCDVGVEAACDQLSFEAEARRAWLAKQDAPSRGSSGGAASAAAKPLASASAASAAAAAAAAALAVAAQRMGFSAEAAQRVAAVMTAAAAAADAQTDGDAPAADVDRGGRRGGTS
jgi:hypothetical protein